MPNKIRRYLRLGLSTDAKLSKKFSSDFSGLIAGSTDYLVVKVSVPDTLADYAMAAVFAVANKLNERTVYTMDPLKCIDVSKHQGKFNWEEAYSKGIRYAMLRAGYGAGYTDVQFTRNVQECERLGIAWGAYWYSYATTEAGARAEAKHFLNALKGYKPTMPIAYDIEYEPGILALSNAQRTAMVKAFLGELEAAGYYSILYASCDFIRNRLNWNELKNYDVWVAQYASKCTCPLPYGIWQYSSSNPLGLAGYGKSLDCNKVYKDYPALIMAAGLNGWPKASADESTSDTGEPTSKLQIITIGPVSQGDANAVLAVCQARGLTDAGLYKSQWA